ncbi:MAG: hypothetical protein MK098_05830 [Marinovum sp.]|nr:hypothetical protein [Marinovum sp.]
MRFSLVFASLMALGLGATPSFAAPEAYECDLSAGIGANQWVSPRYIFSFDRKTNVAAVTDRLAATFFDGRPAPARIKRETRNGGVVLVWEVNARSASGQNAKFRYSAIIDGRTKRVNVSANPLAYNNNFNGSGKCTQLVVN